MIYLQISNPYLLTLLIAEDLSRGLLVPEAQRPLEDFFEGLPKLPSLEGLAIIIDAWGPNENEVPEGGQMYWHFIQRYWPISDSPEAIHVVEYIGKGLRNLREVYGHKTKPSFRLGAYFSHTTKERHFNSHVTGIIRRTFEKELGMFGVGRSEDEPPSAFLVIKIDQPQPISPLL